MIYIKKFFACFVTILLLASCFSMTSAYSKNDTNYYLDSEGEKVPIPISYITTSVFTWFGEYGTLSSPQDLFYDGEKYLYIADSGNNRILKCTLDGKVVLEYAGNEDYTLNGPSGIYAAKNGDMYIADTGNNRILYVNAKGEYLGKYVKPESYLLSDTLSFNPEKVAFGHTTGLIYALKGKQFLSIDTDNNFMGFVGANKVEFSLKNLLIRLFATKEQKRKIIKVEPEPYSNFLITDDGIIYAVTLSDSNQIRKINSVGNNIYPNGVYCENSVNDIGAVQSPYIVDIAVDPIGIVTVLEKNTCQIYQYDQEGNLLTVFGGEGINEGHFVSPISIVEDNEGKLYILDKTSNNIQVMEATNFIKNVHTALQHYYNGEYDKAGDYWNSVLNIDQNYDIALSGLAKSLYKNDEYDKAMSYYKHGNNAKGYSDAFSEYRHDIFRNNFALVVAIGLLIVIVIILLFSLLKKKADKVSRKILEGRQTANE